MTGQTFANRYRLGERIGQGGMAEVYSAQDMVLGRVVAVKVMLPQYAADPDFTRRFRQEAAAAANLQSPYIVNVYDWGHEEDTYYIVMEYVRGSDLKTAILERGAINQRKVAEIGSQVCQALTVAHRQDIIHRDIKSQNIMIQPDGNVKVMDFGIARAKNSTADKTQTVLGTAHYTSPEQAQGLELGPASDIYSLGVVLFEAATGKLPFDGPDAVSVALMQVRDQPPSPRSINPNIDPTFEAIILTAMAKDPAERFATANDMRVALNDFLAGRPVNFAALVAGGAAAVGLGALASDDFTNARTSVISPIGAAAGDVGATQVMPVAGVSGQAANYDTRQSGSDSRRYQDEPRRSGGKGKKVAIVIAVIAVLVVAGIAGAFALGILGGDQIAVPDVVNKSAEEAEQLIEDAGFVVGDKQSEYNDNVEAGTVVSQNPKGGSKAAKGSTIDLVISQGKEELTVPPVTGLTEGEARTALTSQGFTVGAVTQEASSEVEKGKVISQDPNSGMTAAKGSMVNLVISSGVEEVTVPSFAGMTLDEARAAASEVGLTISQGSSQNSSTVAAGDIISQSPTAGSKVAKGASVTVVVSLGKDTSVTVPNVTGYSQAYAQSALENAGLKVEVTTSTSSTVSAGNVIVQNPEAKTSAKQGDTVVIEVSTGSGNSDGSGSTTSGS